MIKFFRKIRHKLLSDLLDGKAGNKFSKYLIYAFGEIILVVIGILFALQINNWNENRKASANEIVLLKKLKEENIINIKSVEAHKTFRNDIKYQMGEFVDLLEEKNLEPKSETVKEYLINVMQSSAYTFTQSNLNNYIKTYNAKNAELNQEFVTLEFYQKDLELSSNKGLDMKIKYLFESLENDIDFASLDIKSYQTLESLKFKNNMLVLADIEFEISTMYDRTLKQMKKVDSLISIKLKK